jgi:hypothetical protein
MIARKPKFQRDQVVRKAGFRGKHKAPVYGKIEAVQEPNARNRYFMYLVEFQQDATLGDFEPWFRESELVALTDKEVGPREL